MSRNATRIALTIAAAVGFGGLTAITTPLATTAAATESGAKSTSDFSAQRGERGERRGEGRGAGRPGGGGQGGRPAMRPDRPAGGQGRPSAGSGRPSAGPGRPGMGAGRPGMAPGRPAGRPPVRTVRPVGPGPRVGAIRGGSVRIGGRPVVVVRGPRAVYYRGRRWGLAPVVALGALTVGALAYSAYAYVPVEAPVCTGVTEDGCLLRWTNVPAQDDPSVLIPQCVSYCPR